jgi:hypothetical protein
MKEYKEFTFGWIIFAFVVPIQILLAYLYVYNIGDRPLDLNGFILTSLVIILVEVLFYGLTTKVTSDMIVVSFGIGLIRNKIDLKRIEAVKAVETPWYYGWGIRMIPNGVLYNISGTAGVELKFKDTNRRFIIGTKKPLVLKFEIDKRLKDETTAT